MDYTRIPELQEHLPYLQEQVKDWVTWDGKPISVWWRRSMGVWTALNARRKYIISLPFVDTPPPPARAAARALHSASR